MYRIIACDMDETLLGKDKKVSQRNREAIAAAREAGVKFVPNTGRGFASIQGTLEELGLRNKANEYVISFNGGAITENAGNRLIHAIALPFAKAEELYRRGIDYDVCILPSSGEMSSSSITFCIIVATVVSISSLS